MSETKLINVYLTMVLYDEHGAKHSVKGIKVVKYCDHERVVRELQGTIDQLKRDWALDRAAWDTEAADLRTKCEALKVERDELEARKEEGCKTIRALEAKVTQLTMQQTEMAQRIEQLEAP